MATTDNSQNNQQSAPAHPAVRHPTLEGLILDQKVTLRAPLEAGHRRDRPLLLCQGPPFRWDPVPHHPVVPRTYNQPTVRRSCPIAVGLPHSCQHGRLAIRKPVVVEYHPLHNQPNLVTLRATMVTHL